MNILFIGDYSNLHACLADEARQRGDFVTLVSNGGGYQQTANDIRLERTSGRLSSFRYLGNILRILPKLKGYDVVQFINPHFFNLKPSRLSKILKFIKSQNGALFLTLCGNDHYFVKYCMEGSFRFSEFMIGNSPTEYSTTFPDRFSGWMRDDVRAYSELFYKNMTGGMAVLPEYLLAAQDIMGDRCKFTNIPINLATHPFRKRSFENPLDVMVGMKPEMSIQKGTGHLLEICQKIAYESHGNIIVEQVGGISYTKYLKRMAKADVVIDQLYSYSPATNALDAMAIGAVCASGAEGEYYKMINENVRRPVIQLSPLIPDLEYSLKEILSNREALRRMSVEGREIVEKHNDVRIVYPKFKEQWEKLM